MFNKIVRLISWQHYTSGQRHVARPGKRVLNTLWGSRPSYCLKMEGWKRWYVYFKTTELSYNLSLWDLIRWQIVWNTQQQNYYHMKSSCTDIVIKHKRMWEIHYNLLNIFLRKAQVFYISCINHVPWISPGETLGTSLVLHFATRVSLLFMRLFFFFCTQ